MESTRELPVQPKSWFFVTEEKNITNKPFASNVAGLDIILFRSNGKITAMSRRCPHMNADLALGCVVDGKVQCSLHHKKFYQEAYPVVVRHGLVFIFNDKKASFDLPFFAGVDPISLLPSTVKSIKLENEWFVGAANAFDIDHFQFVHLRHLLKEPVLSQPDAHSFRIRLDYEIRGTSFSDKLMKFFYGKQASLDFTVYAGNFILAVTTVKDLKNYMMIVNAPVAKGKSEAKIMVFGKSLKREIQVYFSQRFFQDEADNSKGVFIDTKTLAPEDTVLKKYLEWLLSYYS